MTDRAHDPREHHAPRGLRLDQAAAAWHALTSPRTVEVITGPAGTGKTRVLAAIAWAWDGPVVGTATSQNATNELRAAGIQVAANTTRLLADLNEGRILPGSLILADEGSMISITHLAAITGYAARNRCKLILAGDQEQLAAVEGGGAMTLLADRLGYVQLLDGAQDADDGGGIAASGMPMTAQRAGGWRSFVGGGALTMGRGVRVAVGGECRHGEERRMWRGLSPLSLAKPSGRGR